MRKIGRMSSRLLTWISWTSCCARAFLAVTGVLDDLAQLADQLFEVGGGRQLLGGAGRQRLLELQLAGLQVGQLGAEGLETLAALGLRQGAGLKGAQVALDGGFGLVDLGADRGQFPSARSRASLTWLRMARDACWARSVRAKMSSRPSRMAWSSWSAGSRSDGQACLP
jgi:hypothetical protein